MTHGCIMSSSKCKEIVSIFILFVVILIFLYRFQVGALSRALALSQSESDSECQSESDYNFENYPNLSCWLATFWTITSPVLPMNVAIPYFVLKI